MSNLRSDCRDLVKDLPAGDTWKCHIERLCHQVDQIEETWHAAERRAVDAEAKLSLWQWLAEMGCNVYRNSVIGLPNWYVADVDNDVIGSGYSPEDAIKQARKIVDGVAEGTPPGPAAK